MRYWEAATRLIGSLAGWTFLEGSAYKLPRFFLRYLRPTSMEVDGRLR